ncbi:MAG: Gfo/Idh/MocA family oxidoreductase [Planctomycetaceae bacterium]|jgi:predicted dehydrogenase|nr:Gfo/Idh/MocA family oxidoreductase [Planctomycetaceae bacterium]
MNQNICLNRRRFLAVGAAALASPLVLPSRILGREKFFAPNEQIPMAMVGYGNRGSEIAGGFLDRRRGFRMLAFADAKKNRREEAKNRTDKQYGNSDCKLYERYEDILDRDDIAVIAIATPDHWHTKIAVEACKAGKDVYSEKPLTLTPAECRQIVAAARKYNRVCTSGSQRVMQDYGYMAPVIQSGAIGEVKDAFYNVGGPPDDAYYPPEKVPEGLDWDRWLGPAPFVPYHPERCSGNYGGGWRRYWDYGNGFLADWGAHKLGGILYVLGIDHLEPLEILPPKCEKNPENHLIFLYPGGIKIHHVPGTRHDITFAGSEGEYRHQTDRNRIKPLCHVDVRQYSGGANNIQDDFAYCVRNRLRPFQDFAYGAATALACQLANICYKVNRPLKWDAENTAFIGDEQANRFVSRPKRAPYEIAEI